MLITYAVYLLLVIDYIHQLVIDEEVAGQSVVTCRKNTSSPSSVLQLIFIFYSLEYVVLFSSVISI